MPETRTLGLQKNSVIMNSTYIPREVLDLAAAEDAKFAATLQSQYDHEHAQHMSNTEQQQQNRNRPTQPTQPQINSFTQAMASALLSSGNQTSGNQTSSNDSLQELIQAQQAYDRQHRRMREQQRLQQAQQLQQIQQLQQLQQLNQGLQGGSGGQPHPLQQMLSSMGLNVRMQQGGGMRIVSGNRHQHVDPSQMTYEQLLALQQRVGNVNQGASEQRIDQLPTSKYNSGKPTSSNTSSSSSTESSSNDPDQDNTCSICMSEFEDGETIRRLPCFHAYHSSCIDQWLKQKAQCPVCRADV